jgi:hypothetical protein
MFSETYCLHPKIMKLWDIKTQKNAFSILINTDNFVQESNYFIMLKKISGKGTGYGANIHVGYTIWFQTLPHKGALPVEQFSCLCSTDILYAVLIMC